MKRLFVFLTGLCLLVTQFVMYMPASAAVSDQPEELTVGTKLAGDIVADFDPASGDEFTEAYLPLTVKLEANTPYQLNLKSEIVPDPSDDAYIMSCLILSTKMVDGRLEPTGMILDAGKRSENAKDLALQNTMFVQEAGTYLLLVRLNIEISANREDPLSGKYEVLLAKSELKATVLESKWSTLSYADEGAVAVAPDGTTYVAAYTSAEEIKEEEGPMLRSSNVEAHPKHYLSAIAPDGKLKWQFALAAPTDATPLIGPDGTVYVGTYSTDYDESTGAALEEPAGVFHAINPDGTQKWKRVFKEVDTAEERDDFDFWFSSALADGKLIVKADSELLALNAATGDTVWQVKNDEFEMRNYAYSNPVIAGGNVYVAASLLKDGETKKELALLAFDLKTGTLKFSKECETPVLEWDWADGPNDCIMAADAEGVLYVTFDRQKVAESTDNLAQNELFAIMPDGTVKWSVDTGLRDNDSSPVLVSNDVVYTAGTDAKTGTVVMLTYDAKTGKKLAAKEISLMNNVSNMALAENGDVYFIDESGTLVGMKTDGTYVWAPLTDRGEGEGCDSQIAITKEGKLYVIDAKRASSVLCFDIGAGCAQGWSMSFANAARQNTYTGNHKISFETNGAAAIAPQWMNLNDLVVKPSDPAKDDAVFKGWFVDAACTQAYDFTAKVNKNFTLYAKWETIAVSSTEPESNPSSETTPTPPTGVAGISGVALILLAGGATLVVASSKKKQK